MLKIRRAVSALMLLLVAWNPDASAQNSGAVYTTNQSGSTVNGNLYNNVNHVYLNAGAGPNMPCNGQGVADGRYYFQVTNPSGSALLSSDPIANREVAVVGGVIASTPGTHQLRNGICGSKIVALAPFAPSSSASGECKVWFTPVNRYDPAGSGFFGFQASFSKTDNFKIRMGSGGPSAQSVIRGMKFYDFNENGLWDFTVPEETPIAGWRIEILRNGSLDGVTFTDANGRYAFIRNRDGATYTVREVAPTPGFIPEPGATWLALTPVEGMVLANAEEVAGPDFGNLHFELAPGVGRTKGFWHNQGESLLQATDPLWRAALTGTSSSPVCLRTSISTADPFLSIFIVPAAPASFESAFAAWADYIVGNPALGHAAYLLSSQLAPAILNNTCGFMQGTVYIDRLQNGVLVSFRSMVDGATALLCHPGAGLTGPQDPFQELREMILACTNEFDAINNTGDLNSPQVVYLASRASPSFASPYEP